jgi:23S rRNA pseudouridine955/2504/2580 synthase
MANFERRVDLGTNDDGRRLDRVLRKLLPDMGMGSIFRALRRKDIRINGGRATPETRVCDGDALTFRGPIAEAVVLPDPASKAPAIEAQRIIHANADVMVVNKLPGELTHGEHSLLQRVEAHWEQHGLRKAVSGVSFRPGPVHRLDRNTSGLVMYALSTAGAQEASRLLQMRLIQKEYLTLLQGALPARTVWSQPIDRDRSRHTSFIDPAGHSARSIALPLLSREGVTLALVTIESGRTHQIRAHAAANGYPLAGDAKYGASRSQPYFLHAIRLTLRERSEVLDFHELIAPLPRTSVGRLRQAFPEGVPEVLLEHGLKPAFW